MLETYDYFNSRGVEIARQVRPNGGDLLRWPIHESKIVHFLYFGFTSAHLPVLNGFWYAVQVMVQVSVATAGVRSED